MFKRRNARSYPQMAQDMVYPRGGWGRAARYLAHRLRRIPDAPHRIGRGIGIGIFVSFTPLLGAHVVIAMALAWLVGANIFAAVLGTLVGNPLTLPFVAVLCVGAGRWMLGMDGQIGPKTIISEITRALGDIANNILSIAGGEPAPWGHVAAVWDEILLPYTVGGLVIGLIAGIAGHYLTVPLIRGHQRRRAARLAQRRGERPTVASQG